MKTFFTLLLTFALTGCYSDGMKIGTGNNLLPYPCPEFKVIDSGSTIIFLGIAVFTMFVFFISLGRSAKKEYYEGDDDTHFSE